MHEYIFDIYRQWRNKDNKNFFSKLLKLLLATIIILFLLTMGIFGSLSLLIFSEYIGNWIILPAMGIYVLCCLIANAYGKRFTTKQSKKRYQNYIGYCQSLKTVLIDNLKQIEQDESYLTNIKTAIDDKIADMQKQYDKIFMSINNFQQILIIPITIALITGITGKDIPIEQIISISVVLALSTLILYLAIWGIASLLGLIIKDEINEYKQFSSDIAAVMDIKSSKSTENKK